MKSDGNKAQLETNNSKQKGIKHIPYTKGLTFNTNDLSQITIPANALYEDLDLQYSYSQGKYGCIHQIGNNTVPLHKKFTMKLRYNKDLTNKNKALIVRISDKGGKTSIGGKVEGDYIVASTFDFGRYAIEIDTTAPKITAKNFKDKQKLNPKQKFIQIKVTDNLAGIRNVNAYLNDKWHLMEYDGKTSTIFCPASEIPKGENKLKIIATDEKNNKTTTTFTIVK